MPGQTARAMQAKATSSRTTRTADKPSSTAAKDKATTSRATAASSTRAAAQSTLAKVRHASANSLARDVEKGLKISSESKDKQKLTPEETKVAAMRSVNNASQALSAAIQSGWKHTSEKAVSRQADTTSNTVRSAISLATASLEELRSVSQEDLNVERAASSIVGKLVTLEMYDDATSMLESIHRRLQILVLKEPPSQPTQFAAMTLSSLHLATFDAITLTLLSSHLLYAIIAVANRTLLPPTNPSIVEQFADALSTTSTLLTWVPILSTLPTKHVDGLLTRAYTVLTKLCSLPDLPPQAVLSIRTYALRCLLFASSGTVKPSTFWEQTQKSCILFVRTSKLETAATAEFVTSRVKMIVMDAQNGTFLTDSAFVNFCDFWMSIAKKDRNIAVLDEITTLMRGSPSRSPTPASSSVDQLIEKVKDMNVSEKTNIQAILRESAKACATLVKSTAVIEQQPTGDGDEGFEERLAEGRSAVASLDDLRQSLTQDAEASEDAQRTAGKLDRALERLRRACIRVVEQPPKNRAVTDGTLLLLEMIVAFLSKRCASETYSQDLFTPTLDTLFVLARKRLDCCNPDTYTPTLQLLGQATKLVDTARGASPAQLANYIRCISGALHNLAGTLYQADRYGGAVRFLNEGCALGVRALAMYSPETQMSANKPGEAGTPAEEREREGWRQLQDQLSRRWELLGVCHSKIGDRRPAYDGFVQSVRYFSYETSAIEENIKKGAISVFAATPALKHLGSIVDKLTYVGACELFMSGREISLRTALLDKTPAVAGMIVERQLDTLENSIWKEGIRAVVKDLLDEVLLIYEAGKLPLRRSRVLLRCMEFLWKTPGVDSLWDGATLGDEVLRLTGTEPQDADKPFAQYRQQYAASAHFWLGLLAYRQAADDQVSRVAQHAEEGCMMLRSILHPPAPASEVKSKKASVAAKATKTATKTTRQASIAARTTTRTVRTRVTKKAEKPVTPTSRQALGSVSLNVDQADKTTSPKQVTIQAHEVNVENPQSLARLLHLYVHILSLLDLGPLKVKLLAATQRLCVNFHQDLSDVLVSVSADLACEYVKLGKIKRAANVFAQTMDVNKSSAVSDDVRVRYLLRYAETLALSDNIMGGASAYCEALGYSEMILPEEKHMSTAERVRLRVGRVERAAMAAYVFAIIQYSKDNIVEAIQSLLQALRLWNRAIDTFQRLRPTPAASKSSVQAEEENPFKAPAKNEEPEEPPKNPRRHLMDGIEWRVADGLSDTLFALASAFFSRGSPREAEYFARQAIDLAESLGAPAMASRALARLGEVQLHQGALDAAQDTLSRAAELLAGAQGAVVADVQRLRAHWSQLREQEEDARTMYHEAGKLLEELNGVFAQMDGSRRKSSIGISPRASIGGTATESAVPALLSAILRKHIWLLRDEGGDEPRALIDQLLALPPSAEVKAAENALMGKLTLHGVYEQFHSDMALMSLAESTIALPTGISSDKPFPLTATTQEVLATLENADGLFSAYLSSAGRKGLVSDVREAVMSRAIIRAFHTSLGNPDGTQLTVGLLDASAAITLHRELLDAIHHKFPAMQFSDDLLWPLMTPSGSPLTRPPVPSRSFPKLIGRPSRRAISPSPLSESDSDDDETPTPSKVLEDYWASLKRKYASISLDAASLSTPRTNTLPAHWTVLHLVLAEDKSALFVSRQNRGAEPMVFRVPLKGRRLDDDEDEAEVETGDADTALPEGGQLSYAAAVRELKEIVRLSDEGTRGAVKVRADDQQARAAWWAERSRLDKRMKTLLESVEEGWLGGFKTLLTRPLQTPEAVVSDLRARLDKVFRPIVHPHKSVSRSASRSSNRSTKSASEGKSKAPTSSKSKASGKGKSTSTLPPLSDELLACLSSLSPKCSDGALHDVLYFVLDAYHLAGEPVAIAEVDIDEAAVKLRAALEEHAGFAKRFFVSNPDEVRQGDEEEHLFLVLDKDLQGIPWESIPCLRGRSVSRIPSLEFLLDRVEWSKVHRKLSGSNNSRDPADETRLSVNAAKTYYVLNPSGDLAGTQSRFEPWLNDMRREAKWDGIVGRAPSEGEWVHALENSELVLYFGHGGAEQYVRSHKVRHVKRCAATMLWGCSSGALKEMGEFERTGTAWNYMVGGCPSLVANLWDVTDRDIDKFAQAVFDKLELTPDRVGRASVAATGKAQDRASTAKSTIKAKINGSGATTTEAMGTRAQTVSVVSAVARSREACKLKYLTGAAPVVYGIPFYV